MLTLDEALLLAKSSNRDLKQYVLDVSKQREAVAEAKTHLYPRFDTSVLAAQLLAPLDFTIQKGQFGTFPGTGAIPGSNTDLHTPARPIAIASVTATQPLTQLLRIHLSIASERLKVDAAQFSFHQREQKLAADVRQSYYQVLQEQIQYESQQAMVRYLEELLQLTVWRFSQHAVLEADRLSVKAEVAKANYELTTIEDRLADSKEALNHLLGRGVQTEFSVEPVAATLPEEQNLVTARTDALEHRPEMKIAENRKHQAELEIKSEKTHYIPDIAIQASYFSPVNINFLPQNVSAVGALFTWQPWDWGEKRHKVREAALTEKRAGLSVEDTREQILLDVDSSFRRLREARAHLAVVEALRDAESEKMRNQKEAYSQQSILLSDLLNQQSSLADAVSQYHQAVLAFWSARAFPILWHRSNTPLVLVVLSFTALLSGCSHQSQIPSQPPRAVRLATVAAPETSSETLRYSASILPYAQVDLMFRSSGYVTNVRPVRGADGRTRDIGTGDFVEQGLSLAHIRREDLENQVAQAQAQLDQATAQHTKADQDFQRARALYSTQSLTKPDYDQSQAAFYATQAAMDNAKAALLQSQLTLGDADLKAPFSGYILSRSIDVGSLVSPSTSAFAIADIGRVKVTFGAPDYVLNRVRLGQELAIQTENAGAPLKGRVTSISPAADTRNRIFAVEVTVANGERRLRPGMIASVSLGEVPHSAISIPLSAIVPFPSEPEHFAVLVAQNRGGTLIANLRKVQLGPTHDNSVAVEGVQPGEQVVYVGAQLLRDGDSIQVIP